MPFSPPTLPGPPCLTWMTALQNSREFMNRTRDGTPIQSSRHRKCQSSPRTSSLRGSEEYRALSPVARTWVGMEAPVRVGREGGSRYQGRLLKLGQVFNSQDREERCREPPHSCVRTDGAGPAARLPACVPLADGNGGEMEQAPPSADSSPIPSVKQLWLY